MLKNSCANGEVLVKKMAIKSVPTEIKITKFCDMIRNCSITDNPLLGNPNERQGYSIEMDCQCNNAVLMAIFECLKTLNVSITGMYSTFFTLIMQIYVFFSRILKCLLQKFKMIKLLAYI